MPYTADTKALFQDLYNISRAYADQQGVYNTMGKYADNENKILEGNALLRAAELNPRMARMGSEDEVANNPIKAATNALLHKNAEIGANIFQNLTRRGVSKRDAVAASIQYVQGNIDSLKDFDPDDPEAIYEDKPSFFRTFSKFNYIDREGNVGVDTRVEQEVGLVDSPIFRSTIDMQTKKLGKVDSFVEAVVGNSMALDALSYFWQGRSYTRKGMYRDWEYFGGGVQGGTKLTASIMGLGLSVAEMILASKLTAATAGVAGGTAIAAVANTAHKIDKVRRLISGGMAGMSLMVAKSGYQDATRNNAFAKKYFVSSPLQQQTYGNEFWASRIFDIATYAAGSAAGGLIEARVMRGAGRAVKAALKDSIYGSKMVARKMAFAPLKSAMYDTMSDMAIDLATHNMIEGIWGHGSPVFTKEQRRLLDAGDITPSDVLVMASHRLGARAFAGVLRNYRSLKGNEFTKSAGKGLSDMIDDPDIAGSAAWYEHNFAPDHTMRNMLYKTAFRVGNWLQSNNLANMDEDIRRVSAGQKNLTDYMRSEQFNESTFFKHYLAIEKSQNIFLSGLMDIGGRLIGKNFKVVLEPLSYEAAGRLAATTAMERKRSIHSTPDAINRYAGYITEDLSKTNDTATNIGLLKKKLFNHVTFTRLDNENDKEVLSQAIRKRITDVEPTGELVETFDRWQDITQLRLELGDADKQTPEETVRFNEDLSSKGLADDDYGVSKLMIDNAITSAKQLIAQDDRSNFQENLFKDMFPNYSKELDSISKEFVTILRTKDQTGQSIMDKLDTDPDRAYFELHQRLSEGVNKLIPKYAEEVVTIVNSDVESRLKARQALTALHKLHILADAFGYKSLQGVSEARAIFSATTNETVATFLRKIGSDSELFAEKTYSGMRQYLEKDDWVNSMFSDLVSRANRNLFNLNRLSVLSSDPRLTKSLNLKYYSILRSEDPDNAGKNINELIGMYQSKLSASIGVHRMWEDEVIVKVNGIDLLAHRTTEINGMIERFYNSPRKYKKSYTSEDDDRPDRISSFKLIQATDYTIKKLVDQELADIMAISLRTPSEDYLKNEVKARIGRMLASYGLDGVISIEKVEGSVLRSMAGLTSDPDTPAYDIDIKYDPALASHINNNKSVYAGFLKDSMNMVHKFRETSEIQGVADKTYTNNIFYDGKLIDANDLIDKLAKSMPQGYSMFTSLNMISRVEGNFDEATKAVEGFIYKVTPSIYDKIEPADRKKFAASIVRNARINNFLQETIQFGRLLNEITYDDSPIRNVDALYDLGEMRVANVFFNEDWQVKNPDYSKKLLNAYNSVLLYGTGTGFTRRMAFVDGLTPGDRIRHIQSKMISMLRNENNKNGLDVYGNLIKQLERMDFKGDRGDLVLGGVKQMMKAIIEDRQAKYNAAINKMPTEFQKLKDSPTLPSHGQLIVSDIDRVIGEIDAKLKGLNARSPELNDILSKFDGLERTSGLLESGPLVDSLKRIIATKVAFLENKDDSSFVSLRGGIQNVADTMRLERDRVRAEIDRAIELKNVSEERLRGLESEKIRITDEAFEGLVVDSYDVKAAIEGGKKSDVIVSIREKIEKELKGLEYSRQILGLEKSEYKAISNEREALEFAYSYLAYGEGMITGRDYAKRGGVMPLRNKTTDYSPEVDRIIGDQIAKGGFNIILATTRDVYGTSAGDGLGELPFVLYNYYNSMGLNGFGGKDTYSGAGNTQKLMFTSNVQSTQDKLKLVSIADGKGFSVGENDIVLYVDSIKNISPEFLEASGFIDAASNAQNGNAFKVSWKDNGEFIRKYIHDITRHSSLSSRAQRINYSPQIGIVDSEYNNIANILTNRTIVDFEEKLSRLENDVLSIMDRPEAFNRLIDSSMRSLAKVQGALTILAPMRKMGKQDLTLLSGEDLTAEVEGQKLRVPNTAILSTEMFLSMVREFKSDIKGDDLQALIKAERGLLAVVKDSHKAGRIEIGQVNVDDIKNILDILSKGSNGKFIKDEKGRYWITAVRYPAQGKGQTAPFLIKGIRRAGVHQGIELSPSYTQRLQHTDYDGDRGNILPVSTSIYREMLVAQEVEDPDKISQHIVNKAFNDLINSDQYVDLTIKAPDTYDVNKSSAKNIEMATGLVIKGLDSIPFYRYTLGQGLSKAIAHSATHNVVENVNRLLNDQYQQSETLKPYRADLDSSMADKDAWVLFKENNFIPGADAKASVKKVSEAFLGSFRTFLMSEPVKYKDKKLRVAYATGGRIGGKASNYILLLEADTSNFGYKVSEVRMGGDTGLLTTQLSTYAETAAKSTIISRLNSMAKNIGTGAKLETIAKNDGYARDLRFTDTGKYEIGAQPLRISNVEGFNIVNQNMGVDAAKNKGVQFMYDKYWDGKATSIYEVIRTSISHLYASRMVPIDRITNDDGVVGSIGRLREGMAGKAFLEASMKAEAATNLSRVISSVASGLDSGSENLMSLRDFDILTRNLSKTQLGDAGIVELLNTARKYVGLVKDNKLATNMPATVWRALKMADIMLNKFGVLDTEELKKVLVDPMEANQFLDANGMLVKIGEDFSPMIELGRLTRAFNIADKSFSGIGETRVHGLNKYLASLRNLNIIIEDDIRTEDDLYASISRTVVDLNKNGQLSNGRIVAVSERDVKRILNEAKIKVAEENIAFDRIGGGEIFSLRFGEPIEAVRSRIRAKYEALSDEMKTQLGLKLREVTKDAKEINLTPDRFVSLADDYLGKLRAANIAESEIHKAQAVLNGLMNHMDERSQYTLIPRTQGLTSDVVRIVKQGIDPAGKMKYNIDMLKQFSNSRKQRAFTLDASYLSPNISVTDRTSTQIICGG